MDETTRGPASPSVTDPGGAKLGDGETWRATWADGRYTVDLLDAGSGAWGHKGIIEASLPWHEQAIRDTVLKRFAKLGPWLNLGPDREEDPSWRRRYHRGGL